MSRDLIDTGDVLRLRAKFLVNSTTTDPTDVSFSMREPNGNLVSYTFPANDNIVHPSIGTFYVDYTFSQSGTHWYRWTGTGAAPGAQEASITVRPSRVL